MAARFSPVRRNPANRSTLELTVAPALRVLLPLVVNCPVLGSSCCPSEKLSFREPLRVRFGRNAPVAAR